MRTAVRFPLKLPVSIKTPESELQAQTENISAGGMLLLLDAELSPGSNIEFQIAMPGAVLGAPVDVLVSGAGRVVRCSTEGERRAIAAVIDEYRFERKQ